MSLYQFADISHHKGDLNIQIFANAGHRICISKASDNYHLPNKQGQYNIPAEWHTDAWFVDNYTKTRAAGLVAGAYHFARFDRPLPVSNRGAIVQANLKYFKDAIAQLPEEYQDIKTAVLDIEQSGNQLVNAGLTRPIVSAMAIDICKLFLAEFEHVILYSGSWWTNQWLTAEATEWMAQHMSVWEPEYIGISGNNPSNPNYKPSVPRGFSNEYATKSSDMIGKMFAWQYTDRGRFSGINSNIDLNLTMLTKEELYKLFNDGAVDPPDPPPTDRCPIIRKVIELLEGLC